MLNVECLQIVPLLFTLHLKSKGVLIIFPFKAGCKRTGLDGATGIHTVQDNPLLKSEPVVLLSYNFHNESVMCINMW